MPGKLLGNVFLFLLTFKCQTSIFFQVLTADDFVEKLGCQGQVGLKVISIFGNTGDGKSYTLNNTFFSGKEVFKTSASQLSCTVGVWASYDAVNHAIVLDTEGLLGMSKNQNQRTRLLLKVLAISDVVIYRTRAERLHTDMFTFLGDASDAYLKHFTRELRAVTERGNMDVPLCSLGPAIIIFHETQHTGLLGMSDGETGEFLHFVSYDQSKFKYFTWFVRHNDYL